MTGVWQHIQERYCLPFVISLYNSGDNFKPEFCLPLCFKILHLTARVSHELKSNREIMKIHRVQYNVQFIEINYILLTTTQVKYNKFFLYCTFCYTKFGLKIFEKNFNFWRKIFVAKGLNFGKCSTFISWLMDDNLNMNILFIAFVVTLVLCLEVTLSISNKSSNQCILT